MKHSFGCLSMLNADFMLALWFGERSQSQFARYGFQSKISVGLLPEMLLTLESYNKNSLFQLEQCSWVPCGLNEVTNTVPS